MLVNVQVGGRVIWSSASRSPEYAKCIEKAGFHVVRLSTSEKYMDRVNMYASFYVGIRLSNTTTMPFLNLRADSSSLPLC